MPTDTALSTPFNSLLWRVLVVNPDHYYEGYFSVFDPTRSGFDEARLESEFDMRFPGGATEAIAAYRGARPGLDPNLLTAAMQTDETFRWPAWQLAADRVAADRPTWMYRFDWPTPVFGGMLGACHGVDIPFAFDNLHRPGAEMFTGTGDERAPIAKQFSTAVLAFARDGDPGWSSYDTVTRATQIIGPDPELAKDPDHDLRVMWEQARSR